jgi:hypothetical protein
MATDLTVSLANQPGALASLGEAAGSAGVNLLGLAGIASGASGEVHVAVEDAAAARAALEAAGIRVTDERDVVVIDVDDRPGELGRLMRRVADAEVNVDLVYLATGTRLVVGAADLEAARSALGA